MYLMTNKKDDYRKGISGIYTSSLFVKKKKRLKITSDKAKEKFSVS